MLSLSHPALARTLDEARAEVTKVEARFTALCEAGADANDIGNLDTMGARLSDVIVALSEEANNLSEEDRVQTVYSAIDSVILRARRLRDDIRDETYEIVDCL